MITAGAAAPVLVAPLPPAPGSEFLHPPGDPDRVWDFSNLGDIIDMDIICVYLRDHPDVHKSVAWPKHWSFKNPIILVRFVFCNSRGLPVLTLLYLSQQPYCVECYLNVTPGCPRCFRTIEALQEIYPEARQHVQNNRAHATFPPGWKQGRGPPTDRLVYSTAANFMEFFRGVPC